MFIFISFLLIVVQLATGERVIEEIWRKLLISEPTLTNSVTVFTGRHPSCGFNADEKLLMLIPWYQITQDNSYLAGCVYNQEDGCTYMVLSGEYDDGTRYCNETSEDATFSAISKIQFGMQHPILQYFKPSIVCLFGGCYIRWKWDVLELYTPHKYPYSSNLTGFVTYSGWSPMFGKDI